MASQLTKGPLYALQLPANLLNDLRPRELRVPPDHPLALALALGTTAPTPTPTPTPTPDDRPNAHNDKEEDAPMFHCALTGASFSSAQDLREHYKSDWYNYNVKLRLQGKPTPVGEEEFNALVEDLTDSISGSDTSDAFEAHSSSSSSSSSSSNAVSRLLRQQRLGEPSSLAAIDEDSTLVGPRSAVLWFEAPDVAPGTQFGIYRAIFPTVGAGKSRDEAGFALDELKQLQLEATPSPRKRQWTLLMFGGGHFAGMVVSLEPRLVSKGKGKEKEREPVVLVSKTFHRYTTRKKQGGSQGTSDNAGKASSAGMQIRRHNEDALRDDVREVLLNWKELVQDSELIFLRCSKANYKTFMGYEGASLERKDSRIRGFSFPTKRPTINELIRAFTELTRVKTSHLSPEALAELDSEYLAALQKKKKRTLPTAQRPPPKVTQPQPPKLTKEEELERDRWERLVDMVRRGRIEATASFLEKYYESELDQQGRGRVWETLPSWMEESKTTPTLLHVASAADQSEMVKWLLVEKRANPTLEASIRPRTAHSQSKEDRLMETETTTKPTKPTMTPYELAPSRVTRNVFRALTTLHPDWWDWTGTGPQGARVPSGLNEEKEQEREAKKNDRREKMREKLRERDKEREIKEAKEKQEEVDEAKKKKQEMEKITSNQNNNNNGHKGPQRLGGGPPRAIVNSHMSGLTEQQRMRLEREQRARAAEARLAGGR